MPSREEAGDVSAFLRNNWQVWAIAFCLVLPW